MQTIGLMCFIITKERPSAQSFKQVIRIVMDDLEQFTFRGGGGRNIAEEPEFIKHRDLLHDLYYPVIRMTAKTAIVEDMPETEPPKYSALNMYLVNLYRQSDAELDNELEQATWIWLSSDDLKPL